MHKRLNTSIDSTVVPADRSWRATRPRPSGVAAHATRGDASGHTSAVSASKRASTSCTVLSMLRKSASTAGVAAHRWQWRDAGGGGGRAAAATTCALRSGRGSSRGGASDMAPRRGALITLYDTPPGFRPLFLRHSCSMWVRGRRGAGAGQARLRRHNSLLPGLAGVAAADVPHAVPRDLLRRCNTISLWHAAASGAMPVAHAARASSPGPSCSPLSPRP